VRGEGGDKRVCNVGSASKRWRVGESFRPRCFMAISSWGCSKVKYKAADEHDT